MGAIRTELSQTETRWNDLLRRSEAPTPFLTMEWMLAWLETLGQDREPMVAPAWDGDRLARSLHCWRGRRGRLPRWMRGLGARHAASATIPAMAGSAALLAPVLHDHLQP